MLSAFLLLEAFSQGRDLFVYGVMLILSLIGAIADWQYKKSGGKKTSNRDRILFLVVLVAVPLGILAVLGDFRDNIRYIAPRVTISLLLT